MQKQKGISTLLGITIIIAVAVILFGGLFAYQYFTKPQTPSTNVQSNPNGQNSNAQTAGTTTEKDLLGYWKIGDAEPIAFCDYNPVSGFGQYRSYLHERPAEWGTWKLENGKLTIQYDIPGEKPIIINSITRSGDKLTLNGAVEFDGIYTLVSSCDGQ